MVADFRRILHALTLANVDFVLIGGLALAVRGGTRATGDVDLCYARSEANLERLANALAPFQPSLRGAPPDLPFVWDARTLKSGLNFTLHTSIGDIDLLGEVPGVGDYAQVVKGAEHLEVYGCRVAIASLEVLQRSKRAAGRAKDLLDLAEIAELLKRS